MNFILTYMMGIVVFRESVSLRKMLGIVLVAFAILLLSDQSAQWLSDLWESVVAP